MKHSHEVAMPDDVCSKVICGLGDSDLWRLQKMDDICSNMICGEGEKDTKRQNQN